MRRLDAHVSGDVSAYSVEIMKLSRSIAAGVVDKATAEKSSFSALDMAQSRLVPASPSGLIKPRLALV